MNEDDDHDGADERQHALGLREDFDRPPALDPIADPGGAAFGATGAEASVDLPWLALVRHHVQRRALASSRYEWWVLVAMLAGLFALNFTFTVFVVALPHVEREFHTNYSVLTWVSTGPLLAFGVAAPILGKAGDLFGYRRLYLLGLAGAMVVAVATALAPDVGLLIAARSLDGVQGAASGTASMALILRLFPPEQRVKAMGWWSMIGAGGPVIGVTLGSPIIQYMGWRALFWFQLGLLVVAWGVVALVLPRGLAAAAPPQGVPSGAAADAPLADAPLADGPAADGVPEPADAPAGGRWRGMDWVGSWSLSAMVTGAMLVLSIGPIAGWTSTAVFCSGAVALVALGVFVGREFTATHPLIPPGYFARRNFSFPMGTRACMMFAYFGGFFLFPLVMEEVYGWSPSKVGFVSAVRPLVFAVSSPISGYLTMRIGERTSAVVGAAAVTVSMVMFATLGAHPHLWYIVAALACSGLAMGVSLPATSSIQSTEVKPWEFGVMSAAQQLATQVGEVAGIQVMITIQESMARSRGLAGAKLPDPALFPTFRDAFWVGAFVAIGSVVSALFIRPMARGGRAGDPAGVALG